MAAVVMITVVAQRPARPSSGSQSIVQTMKDKGPCLMSSADVRHRLPHGPIKLYTLMIKLFKSDSPVDRIEMVHVDEERIGYCSRYVTGHALDPFGII